MFCYDLRFQFLFKYSSWKIQHSSMSMIGFVRNRERASKFRASFVLAGLFLTLAMLD